MNVGELRTSGVSSRFEPGGDFRTVQIELVDVRGAQLETAIGSLRAASIELAGVDLRMSTSTPEGSPMPGVRSASIGELRVKDARLVPSGFPFAGSAGRAGTAHWRLEPLGALEGSLHADIVDAAWIFDADVTIPVSHGRIDFNHATVEHIGPDSSMGASRMGVYVDAPSGRTYLFLFSTTHVPGARFESREGGLLPGWRGDRGALDLQPLLEGLLSGMPIGTLATGTRDMVGRTRLRGEFQLGDGAVGDDGHRVVLEGRDRGRNHVGIASLPSGKGTVLRMPDLSARELHWEADGMVVSADSLSAAWSVQVEDASDAPEVTLSIAEMVLQGIRLRGDHEAMPGGAARG